MSVQSLKEVARKAMDDYLYAALDESIEAYSRAIAEMESDLYGHNMHLEEMDYSE